MKEKRHLLPVDILHHTFKRSLRGYNDFEVDEFLKEVAETVEDLLQENLELREKVKSLEEKLRSFTLKEIALQNSLILAEKTAEERLLNAKKEADMIIERANFEAEKIKEKGMQDLKDTLAEIHSLKQQKQNFLIEFETLLKTYLSYISKETKFKDEGEVQNEEKKL